MGWLGPLASPSQAHLLIQVFSLVNWRVGAGGPAGPVGLLPEITRPPFSHPLISRLSPPWSPNSPNTPSDEWPFLLIAIGHGDHFVSHSFLVFCICGYTTCDTDTTPGTDYFPQGSIFKACRTHPVLESVEVLPSVSRRVKPSPVIGIQQKCGGEELCED